MTPWIISQDLMRAIEGDTVRATRYAHHRAHTYRRPGVFLASLCRAWVSKVPVPRRGREAPTDLTVRAQDRLRLTVVDLGTDDTN